MISKRIIIENSVLKCIKNENTENPFISLSDIVSLLFLQKSLTDKRKSVMKRKWRAKTQHTKSIIRRLVNEQRITVSDDVLQSFNCC